MKANYKGEQKNFKSGHYKTEQFARRNKQTTHRDSYLSYFKFIFFIIKKDKEALDLLVFIP